MASQRINTINQDNLSAKKMKYVLPEDQVYWQKIFQVADNLGQAYGFGKIDLPLAEKFNVFAKPIGSMATSLEKKSLGVKNKTKEKMILRPFLAPAFCRAYLENKMADFNQPVKLYSFGPVFCDSKEEAEHQSWQAGFGVFGQKDPVVDAQSIYLFLNILKDLSLKGLSVQINNIGCNQCRPNYRKALNEYYRYKTRLICKNCRDNFKENPLRLLECEGKDCQPIAEAAPQMFDYLCQDCRSHFKNVLEYLDELEIPYFLNSSLIGANDYYNRIVFEIWPEEANQGQKISLAEGGRYDNLTKSLGRKPTPFFGANLEIENIVALMKSRKIQLQNKYQPKLFLIQIGDTSRKKSLRLFEDLRRSGLRVAEAFTQNSFRSQLKEAENLAVKYALILGQKETLDETLIIREMDSGAQETVPLSKAIKVIKK
mgnify:CR=1 FL=1